MDAAVEEIREELEERVNYLPGARASLSRPSASSQRTKYDIEMMQELGYCTGIENYSRVIVRAAPAGSRPYTLLDYFPEDFLLFVDESHVTLPQVRAMYNGDRARKTLAGGLRLPPALRLRQPAAEV